VECLKTLKRTGGIGTGIHVKSPSVSSAETESTLPAIPSPYKIRDLIVRLTQCIEAHTKADDEWRDTILKLLDKRLKEKDSVIDVIKEDRIYAEKDKNRYFRLAIIALLGCLLLAGVKIAELVGLIP
jgi:hypothetical protein